MVKGMELITEKELNDIKMRTLQKWLVVRKGIFIVCRRKADLIDRIKYHNFGYEATIELRLLAELKL